MRGKAQGLTASAGEQTASSGRHGRRRGISGNLGRQKVEDDGVDGIWQRPALLDSAERVLATRRWPWTCQRGKGEAVAAAAASGGDGYTRWREKRRGRPFGEEREVQGGEWKQEGALGVSVARLVGRGRAAEAGGGKASSAHSPRTCLSSWQEEEDHPAPGGLGLFCQVRPRYSLLLYFLFTVFYFISSLF